MVSKNPRLQIIWHYTFEYKNSFLFAWRGGLGFLLWLSGAWGSRQGLAAWEQLNIPCCFPRRKKGQQLFIVILYIVSFSLFVVWVQQQRQKYILTKLLQRKHIHSYISKRKRNPFQAKPWNEILFSWLVKWIIQS